MISPVALALLIASATPESIPCDCGAPADAGKATSEASRFGDWLYERQDFYRAIGEYERAIFLDPDSGTRDLLELRIARAYSAGDQPDAAGALLRRLAADAGESWIRDEALFEQGLLKYRAGDAEAAVAPLSAYFRNRKAGATAEPRRIRLLQVMALARAGAVEEARSALEGALPSADADGVAMSRAIGAVAGSPTRSPVLAGALSFVLPGAGQVYAGDPWAGLGAFSLNAAFVWATADAFRSRQHGLGAVLLVCEGIWWGGAVFGAVAEASRFNRDSRLRAAERMDQEFAWVIAPLPGGAAVGVRRALP